MIVSNDPEHGRILAKAAGTFYNPECDRVLSRVEQGRLLGGIIFTRFTPTSVFMHAAGLEPRWLDKDLLWMLFSYPFEQLRLEKAFVQIPSNNLKSLDFSRKLGFKEVARIVGVSHDVDLVIKSMRREECRWLVRGSRR
jgi:RimJ/RimL family protein N-acetyltransferase